MEWAPAIAGATILLAEANSNSFARLLAPEDYAEAHPQNASNGWGGCEFSGEVAYNGRFVQSGVSFFVSAGDSGLPADYPSASPNVISVGGTSANSPMWAARSAVAGALVNAAWVYDPVSRPGSS